MQACRLSMQAYILTRQACRLSIQACELAWKACLLTRQVCRLSRQACRLAWKACILTRQAVRLDREAVRGRAACPRRYAILYSLPALTLRLISVSLGVLLPCAP